MKFLKKTILLIILVISFCLLSSNVKAFSSTHPNIDFNFIYNNVILKAQEENSDFSFEVYNNFICTTSGSEMSCSFIKEADRNKFTLTYVTSLRFELLEDFNYYYITINKDFTSIKIYIDSAYTKTYWRTTYTNILEYKDLTNIVYLDSGLEEEPKELEITVTGTEVLTFMLDKTKNIYEVLIANQLFVLCSCILLSYLVFIILYKTIRK